jgi:molybdopterin converting factor small subunit
VNGGINHNRDRDKAGNMIVQVRLNAILRKHAPEGNAEFPLQIAEGCTIEDVIALLDIPLAEVSFATVDLKHSPPSRALKTGDQVTLFPPLTGG